MYAVYVVPFDLIPSSCARGMLPRSHQKRLQLPHPLWYDAATMTRESAIKRSPGTNAILHVLSHPRYRGKHVVVVRNKVFAAKTGQEAAKIFRKVVKQYPRAKPTLTYVPKEEVLILIGS